MRLSTFVRSAMLSVPVLLLPACQAAPDVYAMPMRDVYVKLGAVKIAPSGDGPFYRLVTTVQGNGKDEVVWDASGSMAHHKCTMGLAPVDEGRTHVSVTCAGGGAGDGAAAGMVHNMIRNRVIEMVDATLTGRAFDPAKAEGATAWRWPGDGVDGSIGTAAREAIRMDAEAHKAAREAEHESAAFAADQPVDAAAPSAPDETVAQ